MLKAKLATTFLVGVFTGAGLLVGGIYIYLRYADHMVEEYRSEWLPDFDEKMFESATQLSAARSDYERWIATGDVAIWLVDAGALDRAEQLAIEALRRAEHYRKDWNFGNAQHKAHIALGRIALRRQKLSEAKDHLLKAGRTRGSPQLDTFGPSMLLAKELLEKGEKDVVLEYFDLCRAFWEMGNSDLDRWDADVSAGRVPVFGSNLVY
jgi:hypothetical protein